jgi:hypothetical protein
MLSKVELSILHQLDDWYHETDGGRKILPLGWRRRQAEIAHDLCRRGYLAYVVPDHDREDGRRNAFFVLTQRGEEALGEADLI